MDDGPRKTNDFNFCRCVAENPVNFNFLARVLFVKLSKMYSEIYVYIYIHIKNRMIIIFRWSYMMTFVNNRDVNNMLLIDR